MLEAQGASDALVLLDARPDIVLLFTDVVMPGVDGPQSGARGAQAAAGPEGAVHLQLRQDRPAFEGVLKPGGDLISKPFTVDDLAVRIRRLLDEDESPSPA